MNIKEENACCRIADGIKKIRGGNRLMASHDLDLNVTFYRRDEPEKKVGTLKLGGVFDFSLLDAGIVLGIAMLMGSILSSVISVIRRI